MPTGLQTINFAIGMITSVLYTISITLLHEVKSYPSFLHPVLHLLRPHNAGFQSVWQPAQHSITSKLTTLQWMLLNGVITCKTEYSITGSHTMKTSSLCDNLYNTQNNNHAMKASTSLCDNLSNTQYYREPLNKGLQLVWRSVQQHTLFQAVTQWRLAIGVTTCSRRHYGHTMKTSQLTHGHTMKTSNWLMYNTQHYRQPHNEDLQLVWQPAQLQYHYIRPHNEDFQLVWQPVQHTVLLHKATQWRLPAGATTGTTYSIIT